VRYWLCALLGVAIFAASIVAFCSSLGDLLETGTCASGNTPYVISRPCPAGTGTDILLLIGSIFGLFVAMGVFAFRGERPGGRGPGGSPFVAGWAIFFTATGAYSLFHSLSSDSIPVDGKTGGIIVGATFLLMGLPVLIYWIWSVFMDLGGRDERPSTEFTSAASFSPVGDFTPAGDTIADLERLQKLRDSGALTQAEFDAQKARVLRG